MVRQPERTAVSPALPTPRGPLSNHVIGILLDEPTATSDTTLATDRDLDGAEPLGDDLQLALYVCYELHYRGFAGVEAEQEWNPDLLGLRRKLERRFLDAMRERTNNAQMAAQPVQAEMDALCVEPIDADGVSYHLRDSGTWTQFQDFFAARSLYHLKEADPHAWAIPRLRSQAKAALVAVEFDEFGGGRGDAVHQELFADLMAAAELDATYLAYLDCAPAWALAPVNLMSLFGLHRSLRGAAVGHLAATEITSPPGSQRLLEGLERLDAPESCRRFYREHVEADAVHEQVLRHDVVGSLVTAEPELEPDVVFGIRAFLEVEDLFEDGLSTLWSSGAALAS